VTNGPLVRFTVAGAGPGDVVKQTGDVPFELAIASALPFERAEVLVNGEVVWEADGRAKPGPSTHRGILSVPAGGWIAARVHGGEMAWPGMDSYPFAHTAPLWLGARGSTDPAAAARAATDLLAALAVAEQRIRQSYGDTPTPVLLGRLAEARTRLEALVGPR
jgi:TolB protein